MVIEPIQTMAEWRGGYGVELVASLVEKKRARGKEKEKKEMYWRKDDLSINQQLVHRV